MTERIPPPLLALLADLTGWLEANRIPAMVIGGVAASLLGRPRLTQDVDVLAMLPETEWEAALSAAAAAIPDLLEDFEKIVSRRRSRP